MSELRPDAPIQRPATARPREDAPAAVAPPSAEELEAIHRQINLANVVEFSSETNPGTLTPEKLEVMLAGGINRVSVGVQSFNDKALRLLGRIHDREVAVEAFRMLRAAGFDNVNIDLIQSIPGMRTTDVVEDARMVAELSPEHVSYYNLIYEAGTQMTRDRDAGRIIAPGDDQEADTYFEVKAELERAGYAHYEISNFCRPGRECMHNVLYWQGGEYFGCGPSAHSHWDGARFGNIPDLHVYCERLEQDERPFDDVERLDAEEKARETLVMWLRMIDGVDLAEFEQRTGGRVEDLCGPAVEHMVEEGLLDRTENRLALTPEALFISNSVFSELL